MSTTYTPAEDILRPAYFAAPSSATLTEWLSADTGYPSPAIVCGDHALCMDEGESNANGAMIYMWAEYVRDGESWEPVGDGSGCESDARAAALDWVERIAK